mmetsp:Transcript_19154/g.30008  ORF Transcript_19154/g.30008 Transcript_19154/m.30008 type:complete len:405 (+) Transcript_19154:170-1384(+)|eukprot:CAMPEP_0201604544 /NCGR_PEP_ID=MMETSP0492-20130828/4645_1 /ASSEMBLY_ACC=CAM_ASM_000837 /TAXON_ID=420259 /ORGANISM="Thalassiosira gravida, Strain GMp14c1" /LENGTH=404 /DNA_ID=CAMNT_0048068597 /DNA_START=170 /DNA_END=1384 /DNA_ORIENTATION=-
MGIINLWETLLHTYIDNPVVTSAVIAVVTTIGVIAYDVLYGNTIKKPTVRELNIYPIKSCSEIPVDNAAVTPIGFRNDRIFQVVSKVNGKWCYCTPREKRFAKLFQITPILVVDREGIKLKLSSPHRKGNFTLELEDAITSRLVATVIGDEEFTLVDYGDAVAKWLGEAMDVDNPRLVGIPPGEGGFRRQVVVNADQGEALPTSSSSSSSQKYPLSLADEAPFLLTTRESLSDLNLRLKTSGKNAVDMRRFRPNIVIDGLHPWEEDSLKRVRIGGVEFHAWQRCGRCTMTTIDRDTLLRKGGEPLKTLGEFRERQNGQRNFGMHLIPVLDGDKMKGGGDGANNIKVGDDFEILEFDDERQAEWKRLFGGLARGPTVRDLKPSADDTSATKKKTWGEAMRECPFK